MKRYILIFLLLASQCFSASTMINSFNAGELSPLLDSRTDISKYYSGCRQLENMFILTQGPATRRPGTKYIASAKNAADKCRLISFQFAITQAYIIEVGDEYFRFYRNGGQILSAGDPYEISTPYDISDVFELQFVQSADIMYFVHPEYATRKLTRTGHTAWTLTEVTFSRGPFLDENITTTTISSSATTGSVTLTASTSIWNANHVGALWQITHTIPADSVEGTFTGVANSSTINVQLNRTFDFSTHGTWSGTMLLQRSFDAGVTFEDVRVVHYENDGNITYSDEEIVDDAIYRVRMNAYTSGNARFSLIARSHNLNGVADITAFTSGTVVSATVVNTLGLASTTTTKWSEGAWSADEGYPSTVSFYEERLVFAATTNSPQTIWFSQTNDWENFLIGTNDSDAMNYTIAADQVNVIRWLSPQDWLLMGTVAAEWKLGSGTREDPLTPTQVSAKRQTSNGSAYLQPVMVDNVILYVQRQGKKLMELVYSFEPDAFVSPDLTVLSEHITGTGITQMAFQKTPDPILWCITEDGDIAAMTYKRSQDVVGWSRLTFDGDAESVAIIPGTGEDEVWVSVERIINGSTFRYIEQFQPRDYDDQEDGFFVDSGLTFDGGDPVNITRVTKAFPAVVTALSHGFSDGEQVRISSVLGMIELNENVYTVDDSTTHTFSLEDSTGTVDIDSTGFTTYTSNGSVEQVENNFTTLSHLQLETVTTAGDGGFAGTYTVSSGTITLDDFYNTVHAGIPYTSQLKPMRLELKQSQNVQGKTTRITELAVRFFETLGCEYGPDFDTLTPFIFRKEEDPTEAPPPLFTGEKINSFEGDYSNDAAICIEQSLPLPLTVLALIPEFEARQ